MNLETQLGKDYEERLLNYLLHRRENYVLDCSLRRLTKELGWHGKSKFIGQALRHLLDKGKVKKITYQTGIVHWSIADKTVRVQLMDKDGHQWEEINSIPAWLDANEWGLQTVKTFNHVLNVAQKPVKLIKAEVL